MNWKFWTWPAQIRRLSKELAEEMELRAALQKSNREWCKQFRLAEMAVKSLRDDAPVLENPQILAAFTQADDVSPWWQAVNSLVKLRGKEETDAALQANLDSEARHYNAGRAAAIEDLLVLLHQTRARARKANEGESEQAA